MSTGKQIHYEISARRGSRWTIVEVIKDRKEAVEKAETYWKSKKYQGVKVSKEVYDKIENQFSSVEIYSRGAVRKVSKYDQSGTISPCLSPDDLYSPAGRSSIWELLGNTLSDWMLTPTELLHSLEHYYRLYNAGTKLQNAVQRTAVAYESEESSIQERMRKIYKVIDSSIEIIKQNQKHVPSLEIGRLKPIAQALEKKNNRHYLLIAALTEYLRPATTVTDKLGRTVIFLSAQQPGWVIQILDQLIAEFFLHKSPLFQLLGEPEDRGLFMQQIVYLQAGKLTMMGESEYSPRFSDELLRINGFLSQGALPRTAQVIFNRLVTEIEASKPINDHGLIEQLKSLNDLRTTLENMQQDINAIDQIHEALSSRASRLINSQIIGDMLFVLKSPIDQMSALLELEQVTIGNSNKRTVANFILPILSRPEHEAIFMGLDNQPIKRMNDLVGLQKQVMASDLTEMHKRQISEKLDGFCKVILDNTQILKKLHKLDISLQEKAKKILTMIADGYFTNGECRERAETQVRLYMKQPGFAAGLIAGVARVEAEKIVMDFRDLLNRANINRLEEEEASTGS